jgi:DNA polymerase delta subunit 1
MNGKLRKICFKCTYWFFEEIDNETVIHISGRTKDNKTVYVLVKYFRPFCYLELPKRIGWNSYLASLLFEQLQNDMGENAPIEPYNLYEKYKLHYKKLAYTMYLSFPTDTAIKKLSSKCTSARGFAVDGIGSFQADEFIVHEQNLDPILKFTALKDLNLAGWITVEECIPPELEGSSVEERKFSTCDIDFYANWAKVKLEPTPKDVYIFPTYCSFDIECNSKNHNSKLPNPNIPENVIFQISMIFGTLGDPPEKRNKILLSLGKPRKIANANELRVHKSEALLLKDFTKLVQQYDPDIFIGYNIMKFDWNYMIARATEVGCFKDFSKLSRISGKFAKVLKISWGSAAYGKQEFSYMECFGRLNVDILLEVERSVRLPTYRLDAVAQYYLGKNKDDIPARGLFMLFQLTNELLPKAEKGVKVSDLIYFRHKIMDIFTLRKCHGIVKEYRTKLLEADKNTLYSLMQEAMELTGKYCVQDTILPIDLCEKLNLFTTMEEMSNVLKVPCSYLYTRGQQIKVVAQLYRYTIKSGIIIPHSKKTLEEVKKFQGAMVVEAIPGFYQIIMTLDFSSLYPSIIISFNICYTTVLEDNDPTPDSECHIIEWIEHIACEHDPQKRKAKKDGSNVRCGHHRYRFKRVTYEISKTGKVVRKNEGIMPRLERNLLAERKVHKSEMLKAELRIKMNEGTAEEKDIALAKKIGCEIISKGSLGKNEAFLLGVTHGVLNAKQLSVKIAANSAYGILGVPQGYIPLVIGAASVTAMGRFLILAAIEWIKKTYNYAKLIYGDTDSCMIQLEGKTLEETWETAELASKGVSHHLKCRVNNIPEDIVFGEKKIPIMKIKSTDPEFTGLSYKEQCMILDYESCPINLEFENLYKDFYLLSKKRYFARKSDRTGKITGEVNKGSALARRDNCKYLRDSCEEIKNAIMDVKTEEEVMAIVYKRVNMLFARDMKQIPDAHLIIYMGVKSLIDYAKCKKVKKGRVVVSSVPVDKRGNEIEDLEGPLDPRLIYSNIPQVLLALKMTRRGEEIPPNTRLEYIYLENPMAEHQGDKAEDYTYYKENKRIEKLKPDLLHYLEKQFLKPVTELITVRFKKPIVPFIEPKEKLRTFISKMDKNHSYNVSNITKFFRDRKDLGYSEKGVYIGWNAYKKNFKEEIGNEFIKDYVEEVEDDYQILEEWNGEGYNFKGDEAKISYILHDMKYGENEALKISKKKYVGLMDFCHWWKSVDIINRIHRQHGNTIRKWKKPTYTGKAIRVGTSVVMKKDFECEKKLVLAKPEPVLSTTKLGNDRNKNDKKIVELVKVKKGDIGKIISRIELPEDKTLHLYTISFGEKIVEGVNRYDFTTYTVKDGNIIGNMLKYRVHYSLVVKTITILGMKARGEIVDEEEENLLEEDVVVDFEY